MNSVYSRTKSSQTYVHHFIRVGIFSNIASRAARTHTKTNNIPSLWEIVFVVYEVRIHYEQSCAVQCLFWTLVFLLEVLSVRDSYCCLICSYVRRFVIGKKHSNQLSEKCYRYFYLVFFHHFQKCFYSMRSHRLLCWKNGLIKVLCRKRSWRSLPQTLFYFHKILFDTIFIIFYAP